MTEQENERPDIQQDKMTERQMSFLVLSFNHTIIRMYGFIYLCLVFHIHYYKECNAKNTLGASKK